MIHDFQDEAVMGRDNFELTDAQFAPGDRIMHPTADGDRFTCNKACEMVRMQRPVLVARSMRLALTR